MAGDHFTTAYQVAIGVVTSIIFGSAVFWHFDDLISRSATSVVKTSCNRTKIANLRDRAASVLCSDYGTNSIFPCSSRIRLWLESIVSGTSSLLDLPLRVPVSVSVSVSVPVPVPAQP
jgi:hypothetical protein